jgi:hypothetical protein
MVLAGPGQLNEAEAWLNRVLSLWPPADLAELLKQTHSRLAARVKRANAKGLPRMDAAIHLSSALETCRTPKPEEQKQLLAEVVALSQKGLVINNPEEHHRLRHHQGGSVASALQVACIDYVSI